MDKVDTIIIGAGIVGLAIAAECADEVVSLLVLEKEEIYGRGISSRNSEVIHAGIYYPTGSLKAQLCVEGAHILYALAAQGYFSVNKRGKLIVARTEADREELERLYRNGKANGVEGLEFLDKKQTQLKEPLLGDNYGALFSPATGVLNAHAVMDYFYHRACDKGVDFCYGAEVIAIEQQSSGYAVSARDSSGEIVTLHAEHIINAAGLYADTLTARGGIDPEEHDYVIHFCKGDYFSVQGLSKKPLRHLVYPVPDADTGGLGIHTTVDLTGAVRLGPDFTALSKKKEDYAIDANKADDFYNAIKGMLPFIQKKDLAPDFAGIRPELTPIKGAFRDFIITEETDKGKPGFINCVGISSPGLTAACAIGRQVRGLLIQSKV